MMPDNPLVGGVALRRPAIQSPNYVAGVSGWTINADGTVEFNDGTFRGTVTAGKFEGVNFEINSNGAFFYSGTPALGNLIASIAATSGTDAHGNAYSAEVASYFQGISAFLFAGALNLTWAANAEGIGGPAATANAGLNVGIPGNNSTSPSLVVQGPSARNPVGSGVVPFILLEGYSEDGTSAPSITIQNSDGSALPINLNGNINTSAQMNFSAGGLGPFITGEGFHAVSLSGGPAGIAGSIRYKLLPWNAVWLDVEISYTTLAANSTTTIGGLGAGYYPLTARQFALGPGGTVTNANPPRIFVPTSGGLQLILPTGSSGAGGSFMYPNN